jgi:hypothetical protein
MSGLTVLLHHPLQLPLNSTPLTLLAGETVAVLSFSGDSFGRGSGDSRGSRYTYLIAEQDVSAALGFDCVVCNS